ncbi:MAG: hypothetical protein PVH24_01385, partial [Candidatus Zixiibacteriota bacterium]
ASILKEQPRPISELSPVSPPMLDRAIRQCLAKDPDQRWQTAGDLKRALQWISEGGSQVGIPAVVSKRRRVREKASWIIAGAGVLAAAALAFVLLTQTVPERQVGRFTMQTPPGTSSAYWPMISPDGKLLSFHAIDSTGRDMIWIRPVNSLDAYPLAGTENSNRHFWSPDSRYIAFFSRNQLKKIPVAGGPAQLICEAKSGSDGTWGSAGIILFDGTSTDSIRQVSAAGGTVTAATVLNRKEGETYHAWPWFLPDGNHFLFLSPTDSTNRSGGRYRLKVGSLDSRETKSLFDADARVEYAPQGYIIYVKDGIVLARAFDDKSLEVTGEPIPLIQGVGGGWAANFSVSDNGVLFCKTGSSGENSELVWLDRKGNELGKVGQPAAYGDIALSPDGTRLAYDLYDEQAQSTDLWVYDLKRNVSSRLTFDPGQDVWPTWSPDGTQIMFTSDRTGMFGIYSKQANGMGEDKAVYVTDTAQIGPDAFSRDGRRLTYQVLLNGQWEIGLYDIAGDSSAGLMFPSQFGEVRASLSPDGRFVAYQSNESGRAEVYVRDLGKTGGKWQVSSAGGFAPKWRADGKELYFYAEGWDMMAVSVNTQPSFEVGIPVKLFNRTINSNGINRYRYDVSADGQKFLLNVRTSEADEGTFIITQNWDAELNSR